MTEFKQNNSPTIEHIVRDSDGSAIDLSSSGPYGSPSEVRLFLQAPDGDLVVNAAGTIADAETGAVEYDLATDDTGASGTYLAEWQVDFGTVGGRELVLTSPPDGYQRIEVLEALGTVSLGTVDPTSLGTDVDGSGFDITNLNLLEAFVVEAGKLRDRSSDNEYDIDSLGGGFPGVSKDDSQILAAASDINFEATGGATASVSDDGDGTATVSYDAGSGSTVQAEYVTLSTDPGLDSEAVHSSLTGGDLHDPKSHATSHESGGADEVALALAQLTQSGASDGDVPQWDDTAGEWAPAAGGGGGSETTAQQREDAYREDNVDVNSTLAATASQTGSDAEFGEQFGYVVRDGWQVEIIEAGARGETGGGTDKPATAEVYQIEGGTKTLIHSTTQDAVVSEDGNGDIDYSSTLATYQNNAGGPVGLYFRAVASGSSAEEYYVSAYWTILRRPIP